MRGVASFKGWYGRFRLGWYLPLLSAACLSGACSGGENGSAGEGVAADSELPPEHQLAFGAGSFVFEDHLGNRDRPILVRYFLPEDFSPTQTPVVVVMPGASRDGPRYFGDWRPEAERLGFFLLVPEFSVDEYPGNRWYNLGNMFDDQGAPVPDSLWTFTAVEHLFDHAKQLTGGLQPAFRIYGHSAGGQFVHRFLFFRPQAPVEVAVAANAGWYTMPQEDVGFPYGLGSSGIEEAGLASAFSKPTVILLGDQDVDQTQENLRRTPEAMVQGRHRFERGHTFWAAVREAAARIDAPLAWSLDTVPGAHHSNALMAPKAARLLMEERHP